MSLYAFFSNSFRLALSMLGVVILWLVLGPGPASPVVAQTNCQDVTQVPQDECEALVTFYHGTNGSQWKNHTRWTEDNSPCNWYGVTCQDGHVTELRLSSNQLSGPIPPELGRLSQLQYLYLSVNNLSGPIPPELGNLTQLQTLALFSNQLSGTIPPELGNLTQLQTLFLHGNQLSGPIRPELGNLTQLQVMYLDSNDLSGPIPPELENLTQLRTLYLSGNDLSGPIPPELGNLTQLQILSLSSNHLLGLIPVELNQLTNLNYLNLGYNALWAIDPTLLTFLDDTNPGWDRTQTVPPADGRATRLSPTSVRLNWTPIPYRANAGFYRIKVSSVSGGPYILAGTTTDKAANQRVVDNLSPDSPAYFVIETVTTERPHNSTDLTSSPSAEIAVPAAAPPHVWVYLPLVVK